MLIHLHCTIASELKLGESGKRLNQRVDCWLNKPKKIPLNSVGNVTREKEFVLDPKPPPLSLGSI